MKQKITLIIFTIGLLFTAIKAQNVCSALPQNVGIRSFKLGMTEAEAKRRYPKIQIWRDTNNIGMNYSVIGQSYTPLDEVFTESEREGIEYVELYFLDKKLARFRIAYDGFTEFDSITEFTNSIVKTLKLPSADKWQKEKENSLRLNCSNFYIISRLEVKQMASELSKPSLFLSINDFEKTLEEWKKTEKQKQKETFKP